jgi:hypothetical protein
MWGMFAAAQRYKATTDQAVMAPPYDPGAA